MWFSWGKMGQVKARYVYILLVSIIVSLIVILPIYPGIMKPPREKPKSWLLTAEDERNVEEALDNLTRDMSFFNKSADVRSPTLDYVVPNIVHYVWFGGSRSRFRFDNMVAVLSAYKIIRPEAIYFHCDKPPSGPYWKFVKQIPTLQVKHRKPPRNLFGEKTKSPMYETSDSDIARVQILLEYGGIYLDTDVIVVNPLDDLRQHPCTIGLETATRACGGVILGKKKAPFLYLWLNSFLDDYRVKTWAYNSGIVPGKLARRYPDLVHVVKKKFHRPNWTRDEIRLIWGGEGFKWWKNYTVHLWYRLYRTFVHIEGAEPSMSNIKTWKGAFGEMCRYILYDEQPPERSALVVS